MKNPAANSRAFKAPKSKRGVSTPVPPAKSPKTARFNTLEDGLKRPSKAVSAKIANRAPSGTTGGRSVSLTRRLAAYNKYREQFNPLRGLTLAGAIGLLEDYNAGRMADLQWTYFHIEQSDADLIALLELGLSRLAEMDWDIATSEDAEPAEAEAQAEYLREQFDLIGNLEEGIEHLALARFRGFAHCELVQDAAGQITHLEIVDQWNVVRDGLKGGWRYNPEARSTTYAALPPENEMPPERFLTREVRRPVNRIALLKFVRAGLSDKDWDSFIEIYGIPSGVVIGPPNVPAEQRADFESSAGGIAEGGSGYLPNGSTYVQNKAEAANTPFKARLDHLSEKLVLAGTGGKLTMLTDATGLGSGASDAHSKVFDTIASAEAGRISREITKQLCTRWLNERFPGQKHLAYFKLAANEETDTAAIIADVVALSNAGYDLDPAEVAERTGWKVTKRAQPANAPAGFGGEVLNRILNRAMQAEPLDFNARLQQALALPDQAARRQALEGLVSDLPALLHDERAIERSARLLETGMAEALVSGAAATIEKPLSPTK